jgi:hypothetical protein
MSWSIWTSQRSCAVRPIDRGRIGGARTTGFRVEIAAARQWIPVDDGYWDGSFRNLATPLVANEKQKLQNRYGLWYLHRNA